MSAHRSFAERNAPQARFTPHQSAGVDRGVQSKVDRLQELMEQDDPATMDDRIDCARRLAYIAVNERYREIPRMDLRSQALVDSFL